MVFKQLFMHKLDILSKKKLKKVASTRVATLRRLRCVATLLEVLYTYTQ